MAPRAHWKGYLKLSLVSCPIALYPAISAAERISFRQVNRQTGNRLRQQLVDSVTGETVERSELGRGYEVGEEQFLLVGDEEILAARQAPRIQPSAAATEHDGPQASLQAVPAASSRSAGRRLAPPSPPPPPSPPSPAPVSRPQNTRTIEIEHFVARSQIDPRYYEKPYYIAPRDLVGQEAFAVIREAMRGKDMVGLGRVVLSNRERPIAIEPMGKGIRGVTLRFNHEVRSETEYFADIPQLVLPEDLIQVAQHIIDTKAADFDPAFLEDNYRAALAGVLKAKKAELPIDTSVAHPAPQKVVNLMDVLRRSLEAERPRRTTPRLVASTTKPIVKPTPRNTTRRKSGARA
jgi:non-homologous end joining protein Ku